MAQWTLAKGALDALPDPVLVCDADQRLSYVNASAARLLGEDAEALVGRPAASVLPSSVREAAGPPSLDGALEPGAGERVIRAPIKRADGIEIEQTVRVSALPGPDGAPALVVVFRSDAEQQEIEARLAQGQRMASLGRLAAGVAHEINNPLAYVRTSLDIARREVERFRRDGDEARLEKLLELLEHADDGVERVRVIANDLKTFSRGDEGSWMAVELGRVVETAVNLAWNEIRHRAELVRELGPAPPVMGSESRFVQVVVNLLVNAAHAIEASETGRKRITVRTGRASDELVFIEVEDTGCGIDRERLDHIFEPFWTSKPKGIGTGLGLSICHGIVSSAGGEIRVVRTARGAGTTFRVELPAAPEGAFVRDGRPSADPPIGHVQRARILIVDDEPKLGATLALALGERFAVEVVDNGRDAQLVLERDGAFDLVLCDLMMPEVSGMDLYERIAETRPALAARFVFMTGGAFTERARTFLKSHRLRRIDKPFALDRVEQLLSDAAG